MRKNNTETNCNVLKKIFQNQQKWKHAVMHNLLCGSSRYLNLSTLDSALFYYWNFSTLDSSLLYFFFLILKLIRWPLFQHLSSTRKILTVCFDLIKMMLFLQFFCIWTQRFLITIQKFCIVFVIFCYTKTNFWKGL